MPQVSVHLRLRLPLLWLALCIGLALFVPDRVWVTLGVGLGGVFAAASLWSHSLAKHLRGTRHLHFGWVGVGDRLSEQFTLHNNSPFPALWVELQDESNVPNYQVGVVRSITAAATETWKQSAICTRRGQYHLGPWTLRASDPFGLFLVQIHYPQQTEIIIHPPVNTNLPIRLPAGESSGRERSRQRAWQATVNAVTVREYQPHDPLRLMHWKATARHGELMVRQFDLDVTGDIWLLPDLDASAQLGHEVSGTEEHLIILAASLAGQAFRLNRKVGVATYGSRPQLLHPAANQGQQWNILHALALAQADGEVSIAAALHDLSRIIQRGAALLVLTPSSQTDWLPALLPLAQKGVHTQVVLLDRPSFGGSGRSLGLQEAVRQLGFPCDILHQGELGDAAAAAERQGYWEFKVTATGKVITVRDPLSISKQPK
ncbi:MAG: DUF58 domain-containing protein [Chloroflexi bacterium]|nr:DUF58 domain-containing protein [Chloroflexota bacterium]MBP8057670.1 DUF58 domain-containing protein [Chloroflexota bacterium]